MKKLILLSVVALAALTGRAAIGGPDAFGYTYIDSNEPGGPIYSWIEIATPLGGSGTLRSALACDDCHEASIPLGFNFPYYGSSFSSIVMGSNGVAYFENVYLGLSNSCMPGTPSYTMAQYNFIAHLWDDLAPNYQGGVYTQAFTDYFVIEYYDIVPCCSAGDGDTWQLILFSNGNILMQYKELSAQGLQTDLTVGIQNDPTTGLQYVCDGAGNALASGRAILWLAPGNSCTGTVVDLGTGPYCVGDVLNAPVDAINNIWSDLSTGTTFNIAVAGSIGLTSLFNTGCSASTTASASASPTVTASATDLTPCEGEDITLTGSGTDTYVWDNSVTDAVAFTPPSGTTVYTVTGTETATGCSAEATISITPDALPVVNYTEATTTVCDYFTPINLTEGTPAGGTFSGTGVTGNTFDPAQTAGNYDIVYSYTDGNSCTGSDTVTFTVSGCLGLANENGSVFTIYPNPTTGLVNVNGLVAGDKIQVYTADGKLLFAAEATNSTITVDLNAFASGTYVIFVNETASQIQKK